VDLTTTNVLLGILAVMAVLQGVGALLAVRAATRAYRQANERIAELERELQPLAARARVIFDRVERVSARVDHGTEQLDVALAATARGASLMLANVNSRAVRAARVVRGVASGVRAARDAWRSRDVRPVVLTSTPRVHNSNLEDQHVSI
jgi:hypothetical protein